MHQNNPQILIVEDEAVTRNMLKNIFEAEGYQVFEATDGSQMHEVLEQQTINLVIMDINLPGKNGLMLARELRETTEVALMFLTGRDNEIDKILGLEIGADDYITKPFRPKELLSRIKNVLRRHAGHQTIILLDDIQVDTEKAIVKKKDTIINLSALEYKLLTLFIDHRGKLLTRDQLLDEIWNIAGDFVNDNTVTVYIKRLREKIENDPTNPKIIKTVRGLGYRMD